MKRRLLVMNGQKILQNEVDGKWATHKVDKAGAIPPGIYNIHLASPADRTKQNDGVILHADDDFIFQLSNKGTIKYDASDFARPPEVGKNMSVKYAAGVAIAVPSTLTRSHKLSR